MSETYQEQKARLEMMLDNDGTWDLSRNDIAAIESILNRLEILEAALDIVTDPIDGEYRRDDLVSSAEAVIYKAKP